MRRRGAVDFEDASPSFVSAGGTVSFTISIANTLGSALTVSSITDALPAGFAYASTTGTAIGTPATSPSAAATGSIQWTFSPAVSIPASTTRTLIFTATASGTAGTYTNSVSAATSYGTLASGATEIGVGSPSLTILKSASVASANPGDPVAYTITYANDSAVNVTNAVITDVLPVGLDFVSATAGGIYSAGTRTVTWTIGSIASGSGTSSVTVNTTVTNPYPGAATIPLVNTAGIASTETSAASASAPVFVNTPRPQLSIQKEGNVSIAAAGGNVTYTLTYANTGAGPASGVVITDVIPSGWSFSSATAGGSNASGTVTWNIGTVAGGASGSVQLVLTASTRTPAPTRRPTPRRFPEPASRRPPTRSRLRSSSRDRSAARTTSRPVPQRRLRRHAEGREHDRGHRRGHRRDGHRHVHEQRQHGRARSLLSRSRGLESGQHVGEPDQRGSTSIAPTVPA